MNLALTTLLAAALLSCSAVAAADSAAARANQQARTFDEILDDSAVTTRVKLALLAQKEVNALDIDVRTYRGNVQLFGVVDSQWQVVKAAQVAAAVNGVRHVTNELLQRHAVAGARRRFASVAVAAGPVRGRTDAGAAGLHASAHTR